ncbi:PhnD/SsuA/transferrin family substrate-binding protein [Xinfangfangia sp. CPCC 101601]|uniref:PhnD/SsuA/transferrin family substrate-binding protein n=1 Tax=Pseudogemmobacter lacusdianii TaxID=3069608 RepID=A0ABU0VVN5_9RHOB|nr:PhnD/SsuA/transferrin family substrate-binding protein [Xinfangfangia sp. CPCC 101601]MDQ2065748.1 PhnD/SsuA/transferrin family substrate-binding protein [Xinfangfangia sp. CPCC 101601]
MIASLAMYDFGPAEAANDRLWQLIRRALAARGIAAPADLTRGAAAYWPAWQSPDLILAQTCGYPYRSRLHEHVTLVASPDYGLPGCPPGHYKTIFVARADDRRQNLHDFSGAPMAYNEDLSQSGWAAPAQHLLDLGLTPCPRLRSESHRASARAVAAGAADLAGLDALTWRLMQGFDPSATQLKVVAETAPTPVLPFITAKTNPPEPLREALSAAIAALAPADAAALQLRGIVVIPKAAYLAVPTPPPPQHFGMKN